MNQSFDVYALMVACMVVAMYVVTKLAPRVKRLMLLLGCLPALVLLRRTFKHWERGMRKLFMASITCIAGVVSQPGMAQVPVTDVNTDWPWLAVVDEVMRACHHGTLADAFINTPRSFKTSADWEAFKTSEETYQHFTRHSSRCWTKQRWQRYVDARVPMTEKIVLLAEAAQAAASAPAAGRKQ
jgi:hypothetical protein